MLITGASGGIGHAITRAFAARGARLLLTGRRRAVLDSLAAEVSGSAIACDLSRREDVERLIAAALEAETEVLVCNAGAPGGGELVKLEQEEIDLMLEINLRAPIALARALAPAMIERRRGHMVFVSSLSGKVASQAFSIYCATKFGLRGFALSAREDLRAYGVGASVVMPGFIRGAGMFANTEVELPRGVGTRTPEEVAAGVISAIERNRAEVDIAPAFLRLGASFGGLAPDVAAAVSRRFGGERLTSEIELGHRKQ